MARAKTQVKEDLRSLSGPEKAAIFLLSLGEEHATKLWQMLDEEEIKEISQLMSNLGTVTSSLVEKLLIEFVSQMSSTGSLMGSYESTEHSNKWGRVRPPMRSKWTCRLTFLLFRQILASPYRP